MKIGIITDIHENVEILSLALKLAEVRHCDELVCLGDIAGFDRRFYRYDATRSARECLQLVRSNFKWVVAGNHDLHSASRFPVYSDGFGFPAGWFEMSVSERKKTSAGKVWCYEGDAFHDLQEDHLIYLKMLPEYIATSEPGVPCLFSHYLFPDITGSTTRYIERKYQMKGHWDFMFKNGIQFSFSGHSHNHSTGFAYPGTGSFFRAIHSFYNESFTLGDEKVIIVLPPLSGDRGRTGFSVMDTVNMKMDIVLLP